MKSSEAYWIQPLSNEKTVINLKQKLLQKVSAGGINSVDVKVLIGEGKREAKSKELVVNYEPPFTDWLYQYHNISMHNKLNNFK